VGAALRQRVVNRYDSAASVAKIRKVSTAEGQRRYASREELPLPLAVSFVADKEEELVPQYRPSQASAELILREPRTFDSIAIGKEVIGIELLAAIEL